MNPEEVKALPVGTQVCFTALALRTGGGTATSHIRWKSFPLDPVGGKPQRRCGIYIGYRYKDRGYILWGDFPEWIKCGTQLVALVVVNPRHNPMTVMPESLKVSEAHE